MNKPARIARQSPAEPGLSETYLGKKKLMSAVI